MLRAVALVVWLIAGTSAFGAYWIDWEGENWPEAVGYERNWGDSEGGHHGTGAIRTLEDGVLTYDSRSPGDVYDVYNLYRLGQIDPAPGEVFVMEWRLRVDVVNGGHDPNVVIFSDGPWALNFVYAEDRVTSAFEGLLDIPIAPHLWHDYRVTSVDMRHYALEIDGALVHTGVFGYVVSSQSRVTFGDGAITAGSLHDWDYVRFGAVAPEPYGLPVLLLALARRGARRA